MSSLSKMYDETVKCAHGVPTTTRIPCIECQQAATPSLLTTLKKMLVHHEAKAGKLRDAIKAVEANPELEQMDELIRNAKLRAANQGC